VRSEGTEVSSDSSEQSFPAAASSRTLVLEKENSTSSSGEVLHFALRGGSSISWTEGGGRRTRAGDDGPTSAIFPTCSSSNRHSEREYEGRRLTISVRANRIHFDPNQIPQTIRLLPPKDHDSSALDVERGGRELDGLLHCSLNRGLRYTDWKDV